MTHAATAKEKLALALRTALEKIPLDTALREKALAHPIRVEYPEKKFGDYASPVAMELARILKKNPLEIAEGIKAAFTADGRFEKIDVIRPGFLNFTLSESARVEAVREIHSAVSYGAGEKKSGGKTLLEFVSANPTGPLHVGHGRWAAIGDTLARVLRHAGFDIETEFYVNDAGVQVGKLRESVKAVKEGRPVPEDGYRGAYIEDLKNVSEDPVEYFLRTQKETLGKIQCSFDRYFRETTLHESGRVAASVEGLKKLGATFESEGALWFKTTAYGDDKDRVLVKSDKTLTYFAVDIAYHRDKVERKYERLINIFGADHHGYTGRLGAAIAVLSGGKTKLDIVIGQLVSLFRGGEPVRMSKRTGDVVTLDEVIEEIGPDATRFFLANGRAATALEFDLEVAKKQESDNPVYYVQYAHARISSVFKKAGDLGIEPASEKDFSYDCVRGELADELTGMMLRFPDEIAEMSRSLEVHHLPHYLSALASVFHRFYGSAKFVDEADPKKTARILFYLEAVRKVFRTGLSLLGVSAPDKM